ncbi:MAG: family 20 glycosylhydrolase [Clostridia bacterium]|nr:family 20 glycosylhydrolase [Clostridia bacterium]
MRLVKDYLMPCPKKLEQKDGEVKIDGIKVTGYTSDSVVYKTAIEYLNVFGEGEFEVELVKDTVCEGKAESYTLSVNENKAVITANDDAGIFYGVVTLKAIYADNTLPVVEIEDWPDFYDRGLLLENRYGSDFMTLKDYKKAIDYLASMKYNQLTIGVYGCWCVQYDMRLSEFLYLPLECHPELKTPRDIRYWSPKKDKLIVKEDVLPTMFVEDYFNDLIKYAQSRNITIKPLFNSFGHNTLIPRLHPELSARDENGNPTKHGFCVSDEAVFEYMFKIYDEIIDKYMAPNGLDAIEIGLDEVYAWYGEDLDDIFGKFEPYCKCEKCRNMDRTQLMMKFIIRVCKYLKSKGMKHIYIYHDMLFEIFDIVNEDLVKQLKDEDIYDVVVLDWWSYTKEEDVFQRREINGLFRSIGKPFTGYYHWVIPMEYNNNIYAHAKLAKKHGFEGIESYSSFEYCFDRPFMYQAELCWNVDTVEDYDAFLSRYAAKRFPENPDKAKKYLDIMASLTVNDTEVNLMNSLEYYWFTYVTPDEEYPRNFPGGAYKKIFAEKDKYMSYFDSVIERTKKVLKFFYNYDSDFGRVWYAIAKHYYTYATEYKTMVELSDGYNGGTLDRDTVIEKLELLIKLHEDFMATVEDTRIKANSYVYLRNHSIMRQAFIDIRDHFVNCDSPKLDLTDLRYCLSEGFNNLR